MTSTLKFHLRITVPTIILFLLYGELCVYLGKQEILSQPIECTTDRVTLYGVNYTSARVDMMCNGKEVTMEDIPVGFMIIKGNRRILGMRK